MIGRGKNLRRWLAVFATLAMGLAGCDSEEEGVASLEALLVRGRIKTVDGQPIAEVRVQAEGASTRTDDLGRFELAVSAAGEARLSVESPLYTAGELPVRVTAETPASVEIAVKARDTLMLADAAAGGRVQGAEGFALEIPAGALRHQDDMPVEGEVEVRYALIRTPEDITAAPGRMQTQDGALDGYSMAEMRFYQGDERLRVQDELTVELPLLAGHGLEASRALDTYALGEADLRWRRDSQVTVTGDSVSLRTRHDAWLGVAQDLPVDSCVRGRLKTDLEVSVPHTTIRAARERGLSMVQGDTAADGSFCLPVTPDDPWLVSTYYTDGRDGFELEVALDSMEATGMCGDTGCKDVSEVALARVEQAAAP